MASKRGSALLIEQAEARVNHLLPALATYLGIDMQPMPTHRDPLQQKVLQTQWFADTLEAIDRAVVEEREGPQNGEDLPAPHQLADGAFLDRDLLKQQKLDDLKAMAIDAGADAEAVGTMRTKDDVIDAIAAQVDVEATLEGDGEGA